MVRFLFASAENFREKDAMFETVPSYSKQNGQIRENALQSKKENGTMKKAICVGLATVMAFSMLAGGAVQASALSARDAAQSNVVEEENCISGGWKTAASPALTNQVKTLFDKALDGLEGASYTPVALLATRTTASGTQYRVLSKMTICVPDAKETYAVVTLGKNWLSRAELLDIGDALAETDLPTETDRAEGPLDGAWQEAESPVLTDEAKTAFEKATEGFVGVDYKPVALLSTQVVAGTNYRILCEATTVYPGAEMHYAVMTVYEDLEGSASILSISDSLASEAVQT